MIQKKWSKVKLGKDCKTRRNAQIITDNFVRFFRWVLVDSGKSRDIMAELTMITGLETGEAGNGRVFRVGEWAGFCVFGFRRILRVFWLMVLTYIDICV